jgi:hypothetical protein
MQPTLRIGGHFTAKVRRGSQGIPGSERRGRRCGGSILLSRKACPGCLGHLRDPQECNPHHQALRVQENTRRMIKVITPAQQSLITEFRKPAVDRTPRRQIARQQTPRTARSHHIKNAIDDLTHRPGARPSRALCHRQARLDHSPLFICQIALVSVGLTDMLLSGSWGPHVATPGLVSATPGITPTPATQLHSEWPLALK